MKGYKGFYKGLICRGKQYAENTVFEEPEANICENGMHFCKKPFDVLAYYSFVNDDYELNEFAEVEALDEVKTDDDRKFCTKKLKIGAKLSLDGFIQICAETAKGWNNSKSFAKISSSEDSIQVGVTGCESKVATTGFDSKVASTGNHSEVTFTGNYSTAVSTGNYSKVASTGRHSKVASTGRHSKVASTGNYSKVASTGDYSNVAIMGDESTVVSTGESCVICCTGINSRAKSKKGSWITLAEWEWNEEKENYIPICVKTEYVDGEHIKEDVFYTLRDGEFQEVV